MIFVLFEFAIAVLVIVLSGIWWWKTDGLIFEPAITTFIGLGVLADVLRRAPEAWRTPRLQVSKPSIEVDETDIDEVPQTAVTNEANLSSTVFFYRRFTDAFPGVRGLAEFSAVAGTKRLEVLLRNPLTFENEKGGTNLPVWWWRDGDMHISEFRKLNRKTVLLDHQELKLARVVAANPGSYYQCFVYLECMPMRKTGLYKWSRKDIDDSVHDFGYAREEYALLDGRRKISREDYDDGSTTKWGKPVSLSNFQVEIRCRYLTSYNLVLAPFHSPINCRGFRETLSDVMNAILRGDKEVDELVELILKLPKNETH